eukprot:637355-Prymnesium_polylepis.1
MQFAIVGIVAKCQVMRCVLSVRVLWARLKIIHRETVATSFLQLLYYGVRSTDHSSALPPPVLARPLGVPGRLAALERPGACSART